MIKGICHLPAIPLRIEPSSKSEMVSMILFGETFSVGASAADGWVQVTGDEDGYEGWISSRQFIDFEQPQQDHIQKAVASSFPATEADSPLGPIMLPPGAILQGYENSSYQINGKRYAVHSPVHEHTFANIKDIAMRYLNSPYLWGGRIPSGIDCSGFTQTVYRQCGVWLKRDAWQQAEQGKLVSRADAACGDLAFFENDKGRVTHVGIMLTPDTIIHASAYVHIDDINDSGIISRTDGAQTHALKHIKRIITT